MRKGCLRSLKCGMGGYVLGEGCFGGLHSTRAYMHCRVDEWLCGDMAVVSSELMSLYLHIY